MVFIDSVTTRKSALFLSGYKLQIPGVTGKSHFPVKYFLVIFSLHSLHNNNCVYKEKTDVLNLTFNM